jgi:hypothetical protein
MVDYTIEIELIVQVLEFDYPDKNEKEVLEML